MSTELHNTGHAGGNEPRNADVSYEKADVQVGSIYWYLLFLGLAAAASFALTIYILRFTSNFVGGLDTPPPPSRMAMPTPTTMPPEPRLQGVPGHESDPQQDMRDKLKADNAANESAGWIDQTTGIAQIPVHEAMKIIAEKGLPGASAAPAEKAKAAQ
jgi:hypothetical protein